RREELHHCPVHKRRLGQVERESRSIAPQLRRDCIQVILIDLPTKPEGCRLSVGLDLDLESHVREEGKRRATRSGHEMARWFCKACPPVGICQPASGLLAGHLHRRVSAAGGTSGSGTPFSVWLKTKSVAAAPVISRALRL